MNAPTAQRGSREETGIRSGDTLVSREELAQRAARVASGFAAMGVKAGDTVALLLRNELSFLVGLMAAARLGAYSVPVNWHLKSDEVAYLMQDCEAKVLVAHADLLAPVRDAIPADVKILVATPPPEVRAAYGIAQDTWPLPPGTIDWDSWRAQQPEWTAPRVRFPDSMVYTSGTTGKPKGVRRGTPDAEQAAGMDVLRRLLFGLTPDSRSLVTGPMYHSAPNNFCVQAATYSELTVIMPRFDAEEMLQLVERHRITTMFMVPTMFVRLLALPKEVRERYDLSSLRFIVHSAAPCSPEVKKAMIAWWGPILYEFYGASETGPISFTDSKDWLAHPGTVGRIVDGATVAVLDDEGRELPLGQPGELYVKQVYTADFLYHKLPEKRAEVERNGLVSCGDVGYLDAENFLYLCDRKRDMVIAGGVNIYPAEIEATLITCPGVKDCAVFGIPDPDLGESLMAVIERAEGATLEAKDVIAFLKARIAGFKVPRQVTFADSLPREDSGKIFKRKLREPYWADAGRAI
ncbi:acyl-CoA synthetase [Ramlibacter sp.]|uniref:acyl-CoA synthetase n=1 Tax=Ramlibacter sp. TaxID=1917967 RepID=UPI003D09B629